MKLRAKKRRPPAPGRKAASARRRPPSTRPPGLTIPSILLEKEPPPPPPESWPPECAPQPDIPHPALPDVPPASAVLKTIPPMPEPPVPPERQQDKPAIYETAAPEPMMAVKPWVTAPPPMAYEPPLAMAEPEPTSAPGAISLHLLARDPHCLYAAWHMPAELRQQPAQLSADGRLHLKIFSSVLGQEPEDDIPVPARAAGWFVPVRLADMDYQAELGYHSTSGAWVPLARSGAVATPPEAPAPPAPVQMAHRVLDPPKRAIRTMPWSPAAARSARETPSASGRMVTLPTRTPWLQEKQAALERLISVFRHPRPAGSSWLGEEPFTEEVDALAPAAAGPTPAMPASMVKGPGLGLPASPAGAPGQPGMGQEKRFWFMVNAELVIYGATEPGAQVVIGGQPIQLRPDGSFSYRFALPDGSYELPVVAVSGDGTDRRRAGLSFSRASDYQGEVGAHPQAASLKPPLAQNCA